MLQEVATVVRNSGYDPEVAVLGAHSGPKASATGPSEIQQSNALEFQRANC
jgi:hypothetical protein